MIDLSGCKSYASYANAVKAANNAGGGVGLDGFRVRWTVAAREDGRFCLVVFVSEREETMHLAAGLAQAGFYVTN